MLGCQMPAGALFYGKPRRREDVTFNADLRQLTVQTANRLHELVNSGQTPLAEFTLKCENCSLSNVCLPRQSTGKNSVARYMHELLEP